MQIQLIGIVFLVAIVFAFVDWRGIIEKYFGNNPSKARVYLEYKNQIIKSIKARYVYDDEEGLLYVYKFEGNICPVIVPNNYDGSFFRGSLMIKVQLGDVVATNWHRDSVEFGSRKLSMFVLGKFVDDLVKSYTTAGLGFSPKWILVIGGIAVVGFIVYKFVIEGGMLGGGSPAPGTPPVDNKPITGFLSMFGGYNG